MRKLPPPLHLGICLPYAASIRDFVNSGAFAELGQIPGVRLTIYTINPGVPELEFARRTGVALHKLEAYPDTRSERWVKRLYPFFFTDRFAYIRLALVDRPLALLLARGIASLRRAIGTQRFLAIVSRFLLSRYRTRKLPRRLAPETTLFLSTRSLINSLDYGLLAEAAAHGVATIVLAGSWDNFTTKGYFPFPARRTVVWNRKMRDELVSLFDADARTIEIAGYPRARLLRDSVIDESPEAYLHRLGIRGFKRFVLYSASYGELSRTPLAEAPLEYLAARSVCERLGPLLPADTCILVRLHPFSAESDRNHFASLPRCFVHVPGRADAYVERVMGLADEQDLATQLAKSECVVSMASTISIDALVLGRPVLNLDFDPLPNVPRALSIRRFYHFDHFRDLLDAVRLPLARTPEQAAAFVLECLAGQHRRIVEQAAFEALYVPEISGQYPANIRAIVTQLHHEL